MASAKGCWSIGHGTIGGRARIRGFVAKGRCFGTSILLCLLGVRKAKGKTVMSMLGKTFFLVFSKRESSRNKQGVIAPKSGALC